MLKNLLSNAFKFTEKGGVKLEIARDEDDRLALSVIDTGIGIAEEQQHSIFEAFRQADGTISRRYGGTGLGLSISAGAGPPAGRRPSPCHQRTRTGQHASP